MNTLRITFWRLIQDSQDFGSDDDHMVSRAFFDLEYAGVIRRDLHVDIKLPVGGDVDKDPLEVGTVQGYSGPVNYGALREAIEEYFRSLVGSRGRGIRITGGSNIRMRNNTFDQKAVVELPVTTQGGW
jgi:hypothetical protein